MFAEDVRLLPENSFRELLAECRQHPDKFVPLLTDLWRAMNHGEFAASIRTKVLKFNGNLFADARVLPLGREEIGELAEAANKNWKEVEPRHAARTGTRPERAAQTWRALHTARLRRASRGRDHHRAATRRLAQCAGRCRKPARLWRPEGLISSRKGVPRYAVRD